MKKRAKVRGARAKTRRPQAAKPRRSDVLKAALRSQSTPSGEGTEVARLTRELKEARERADGDFGSTAPIKRIAPAT